MEYYAHAGTISLSLSLSLPPLPYPLLISWFLSPGPESSPASSPAPVCSQQQVIIQHNIITTSTTTTVRGSGVHGEANHSRDINPIH